MLSFFLNDGKKTKCYLLAPIEAEILLCLGSAQKIEAESGTIPTKKANYFCS
jgi:hypothetical protein